MSVWSKERRLPRRGWQGERVCSEWRGSGEVRLEVSVQEQALESRQLCVAAAGQDCCDQVIAMLCQREPEGGVRRPPAVGVAVVGATLRAV